MSSLTTSIVVFVAALAAALLGYALQRPLRLLTPDDAMRASARVAVGQVSMLTIIVLGMVTSAARDTYNSGNRVVLERAVQTLELDRVLNAYGVEASEARAKLRETADSRIRAMQSAESYASADQQSMTDQSKGNGIYGAVHALAPTTEFQRDLRTQALSHAVKLAESRWFFTLHSAASPGLFIFVVGLWIGLQTFCMGLFGERNRASYIAIVVLAIVFASAALLLLELEEPFSGFLRVSVDPLERAVQLLGK